MSALNSLLQMYQFLIALLMLITPCVINGNDTDTKTVINIYSITTSFSVGEELERGHQIAFDRTNNNNSILADYYLNFTVLRSGDDSTRALLYALEISYDNTENNDNDSVTVPIVLGCDWSSLSTVTAPTLSAFAWAQISSSSTSVILSETSSFSYFYRTLSTDSLQAQALIYLCESFDWTEIGIIHVNDNYGVYLAVSISELATSKGIGVNSIAFERNKNESYANAVASMKEIGVYIIAIISHGDSDIKRIFKALHDKEMLKYPYFYVGSDGWMDAKVIENITNEWNDYSHFQGIIGTLPWQNAQSPMYSEIESEYRLKYGTESVMGSRLIYGYDSAMVYIAVLQKLDTYYDGLQGMNAYDREEIIARISDIILNEIAFESVTGSVSFNAENGDRDNGAISFGFITERGSLEYFGSAHFLDSNSNNSGNHSFHAILNQSLIVWPDTFSSKHIIPQSKEFKTYQLSVIDRSLFIAITVLFGLCIVCLFAYIIYKNLSLDALNFVVYCGVILALVSVILAGVDERITAINLDVLCNIRVWFVVIAFTLCLTPIFAKTYKLSRIFTELLITKSIPNKQLLTRVCAAAVIDCVLLTIFTSLEPFARVMNEGATVAIDDLQSQQFVYGECRMGNETISYAFYVCVGVWKLCQFIFGVYVSIIVSRMSFTSQIWNVSCIGVLICVEIILLSFGPVSNPNFTFSLTAITTALVMSVIVFDRQCKRAKIKYDLRYNGETTQYTRDDLRMDDERKMKQLLKLRLQEIAKAENWAKEMSECDTTNSVATNTVD